MVEARIPIFGPDPFLSRSLKPKNFLLIEDYFKFILQLPPKVNEPSSYMIY